MFNNVIDRTRSGFIVGSIVALLIVLPGRLFAQSSPLTIQPSTGRVGVGTTNPIVTFDVVGNTWVRRPSTGESDCTEFRRRHK